MLAPACTAGPHAVHRDDDFGLGARSAAVGRLPATYERQFSGGQSRDSGPLLREAITHTTARTWRALLPNFGLPPHSSTPASCPRPLTTVREYRSSTTSTLMASGRHGCEAAPKQLGARRLSHSRQRALPACAHYHDDKWHCVRCPNSEGRVLRRRTGAADGGGGRGGNVGASGRGGAVARAPTCVTGLFSPSK